MKILTDFDGTLTDIQAEYHTLLEIIRDLLARKHFPTDQYQVLFESALLDVQKDFTKYGWIDHERITAYSDEDLFMNIHAGMRIVDDWINSLSEYAYLKHILDDQQTSLMQISEYAYFILNTQPLGPMNTPPDDVVQTILKLLNSGHKIVVTSNSPSTRIIEKLNHVGLHAVEHDLDPQAPLRVRGNSAKFRLGEPSEIHEFDRPVDINRPVYQKILLEEKPDIVIGDVFSLDLALPCDMSQNMKEFSQTKNILLNKSYTPEWAKTSVLSTKNGAIFDHFSDIILAVCESKK